MTKPKDTISNFWIDNINQLLSKLNLESIDGEDFLSLSVINTDDLLTINVNCKSKALVLTLDNINKKLSGGWKHY